MVLIRQVLGNVAKLAGAFWIVAGAWSTANAAGAVSALDDDGQRIILPAPAQRIISLAPHATELLFAAGAGPQLVATVRYADFPEAARQLPRVGDANALDLERIAALRPDLIVVWMHGSSERQIDRLKALKLPVFHSEPRTLAQIGDSLRRLGTLTGHPAEAAQAADAFASQLAALRQRYRDRPPLRVFFQVWQQPVMTVNREHMIHDVIELCGGANVFASQRVLVPVLSAESVLAARPQVLVATSADGRPDDSLAVWRPFKTFEPMATGHVVWLNADLISRATPRVLQGAAQLCEQLDAVRDDLARAKPAVR